ncbi:FAD binding domain-containing protein [Stecheria intestinalis]|uniref:FAD binding domain-containing protein n=1 Tax=Stecheria intestinalis TaxID=2606630 RepID=UPI0023F18059|nr:FAD binding domain-containing protein [Stecheria intestinalis]MDD5881990.1 FAD binding domain-containing protein [Stecheria intestinalis]
MALPEFDYVLAKSLPEAPALNACDDVRVMAGGTDVIFLVQAKALKGLKRVVDLKGIQGLDKVEFVEGDGLHIGSLAKLYAIQNDPEVKKHLPAVAQAAHYVASAQIRRKGTMAGNIINASPSADTVPILLVSMLL